jgi:hypothetical protein
MVNSFRALQHTLIEEDEPFRVDAMLMGLPSLPLASDVRPILLGRQNAFF